MPPRANQVDTLPTTDAPRRQGSIRALTVCHNSPPPAIPSPCKKNSGPSRFMSCVTTSTMSSGLMVLRLASSATSLQRATRSCGCHHQTRGRG